MGQSACRVDGTERLVSGSWGHPPAEAGPGGVGGRRYGAAVAEDLAFDPIEEAQRQWRAHGWDDAAPGMAVVTSIMRAQQLLLARADGVLSDLDLTFARFEVLTLLSFTREGRLPMGKLGARLQVHPASVTSAVDRLERQGFVRREPHPTDGRTTLAVLTDEGRAVASAAGARLNAEVFEALDLTGDEARSLFALLARLR